MVPWSWEGGFGPPPTPTDHHLYATGQQVVHLLVYRRLKRRALCLA